MDHTIVNIIAFIALTFLEYKKIETAKAMGCDFLSEDKLYN
jgi:hypothetical protein